VSDGEQQQQHEGPKFIGNREGSKTLAAALANSKKIVDQAKQK
jgi:hypothetical protein